MLANNFTVKLLAELLCFDKTSSGAAFDLTSKKSRIGCDGPEMIENELMSTIRCLYESKASPHECTVEAFEVITSLLYT